MLTAAERHPAMLVYLDNAQSIGPNSKAGVRMAKGLNENLGREILNPHPRRRRRLRTGGAQPRPHSHRMDRWRSGPETGRAGPLHVRSQPARAGQLESPRQAPIRQRASGPLVSLRSRAPSSDLEAHRSKARASLSLVTRPLLRSLLSSTAPSRTPAAISAPFHVHSSRRPRLGKSALAKSCRPTTRHRAHPRLRTFAAAQ